MGKLDIKKAGAELGFEEGVYGELLLSFIADAEEELRNLGTALNLGDFEVIAGSAHGIKGMAGNLLITHVQDTAKAIEMLAKGVKDKAEISAKLADLERDISELKVQAKRGGAESEAAGKATSKILVVDDKATNRQFLRTILTDAGEGYTVREADSGQAAIEAVMADAPDIILLDVMMPGLSGFDVCEKLRADKKYSGIPVLFITALTNTQDMVKCFSAGGADYITKPINSEEIKARVKTHLRILRAEAALVKAEKLKTVQDMVATYNHNINQALMVIYTYMNLIMAGAGEGDKNMKTYKNMKKELDKINAILKDIRDIQSVERVEYVGDSGMVKLDGDKPAQ